MHLRFIGSGDAFGSGGRFHTCIQVIGERSNFLIDCGASSLIALKSQGVVPGDIDAIFVTHFHADHFGGFPFFILDAQLVSKRTRPLVVAGPQGLNEACRRVMEASFPGSSKTRQAFDLSLAELKANEEIALAGITVRTFQTDHGVPESASLAYRFDVEGRTIAYTGDTQWTDELIRAGAGADLLVAEAYYYDKKIHYHLDLASLEEKLPAMQPKRLILTHMSEDMLARAGSIPYETAFDGKVVEL